jgi:predicted DNA-binding ribbon-helix-helix protein
MVGQHKDIAADLAPGDELLGAEYERDFYSWLREQARLLREGRVEALDRDNLAEEIESLGREQFNKLVSALRVLMLHMLKWDHQPALRSRSWVLSIEEQRLEIVDVLADNPGLKPRVAEAIARAYRRARLEAAKETGLDEDTFPATCPYSFDDITSATFRGERALGTR